MKRIGLICLGLLGFLCSESYADNFQQCYYQARSYYPQQQYYYYPEYEKIILVPKAIQVEVQRDHYYSIDSSYQQSLLADAIVGRLLQKQQQPIQQQSIQQYPIQQYPIPGSGAPNQNPNGPPPFKSSARQASGYQDKDLIAAINTSCVKCHGSGTNDSGLVLLTSDGKLADLPEGELFKCFAYVNSGKMPKASAPIEDKEIMKKFFFWAEAAHIKGGKS